MTLSSMGPDESGAEPAQPQAVASTPTEETGGAGVGGGSLLSEQSREDTDAGWGEYPERADDRLYRDRPPHWDDF
jgi:hypothetical protein